MTNKNYILAIDQGTTSTRAMIFSTASQIMASHQIEITQHYPKSGWLEHDPEEVFQSVISCCQKAIEKAGIESIDIAAIGISNQRETTVIWDKKTGKAIYPAIVWQDRRTAEFCHKLKADNLESLIQQKTGLLIDPYFSASKIHWLLENVAGARQKAEAGELVFGTIDSYLIWRLTNAKQHVTDISNASRTMLYNIHQQQWDDELLKLFDIPKNLLADVQDNTALFGMTDKAIFGSEIPIHGVAGDQQAALFGQCCFQSGMVKSTYGTGCFMLLNTGEQAIQSKHRLLTTVAYRINNTITYGLEGSIFIAGAAVQWLRDAMLMIADNKDSESIAKSVENNAGVYLVPAFTGLGAPYWDPDARGAILGLTRDTGVGHIVRAALEAVCYQTKDLLEAMQQDSHIDIKSMRVDGGMTANNWLMQFLADILNLTIEKPRITESSALGVAYLAGLGVGLYSSLDDIVKQWQSTESFEPNMSAESRDKLYNGWLDAVSRIANNK